MSKFELNDQQKSAVYYDGDGPLIIEAGPGSGKTRVLTERVNFLVNEKGVDPESVLVITFSRKATEELKSRLSEYISKEDINKMQISTIHSFCFDLLKKYNNFAYEILDDDYKQKKTLFIQRYLPYLGFKNESYLPKGQIKDVIRKFDEYATFKVDSEGLQEYIINSRPLSEEYLDLIDESRLIGFPYSKISVSKPLKKEWYNAKYHQIAAAYPKYRNALEREYLVDYNTLQIEALKFLETNPDTIYKNILIDEFQDTDPVQFLIFKNLLPKADSFTVVGDVDQSIYGFRGGLPHFITDLMNYPNSHVISLDYNYRSTENIVKISEEFIRDKRNPNSQKNMKHNRQYNNSCSYIISEDAGDEAFNILNYIKDLKDKGIIENYSDVAILYRAIRGGKLDDILDLFESNGIPYNVKNYSNLLNNDDIKSFLTILHYILPPFKNHIFSSLERDWLNLKAFTGEHFTPTLWELSDETCKLLNDMQDQFEKDAFETIKEIYERETGMAIGIRGFNGIFNNNSKFAQNKTEDMLIETFEKVPKPQVDPSLITNEKDREFFKKIEDLRYIVENNVIIKILNQFERIRVKSKEQIDVDYTVAKIDYIIDLASKNDSLNQENFTETMEDFKADILNGKYSQEQLFKQLESFNEFVLQFNKDITVQDIFYKILEDVDYFNKCDEKSLNNFSVISESIYNFEEVMENTDIIGYYNFLKNNVDDWEEKSVDEDDGVQLMTIHKSKGLEFPVVIIPSIRQDFFPKKYQDESEKDHIHGKPTYFTPNEFLEYKENSDTEEEYLYELEEQRIIYVALTRAQDTLLLSFIKDIHPLFDNIIEDGLLAQYSSSVIDKCESKYENETEEVLNTSYTSFKTYEECPFKYWLLYDLKFKESTSDKMRMGTAIHNAFNKINVKMIENPDVNIECTDKIITDIFKSTSNIPQDDEAFEEFKNNIYKFYDKLEGINIIESEYRFELIENGYNVVGSIDLIFEKDGEIGIIDFKNTDFDGQNIDKYKDQLKLYLYALSLDSKYGDKNITHAGIYAIISDNLVMGDINKKEVDEYLLKIDDIASKIKNKEFDQNPKFGCGNCKFEFICDASQ